MSDVQIEYLYDQDFEAAVRDAGERLILLDFTADWCAPCIAMEPVVQAVSTEFSGRAKVVKVDLDYSPGITERFGVLSIPTFILLKNGEQVSRLWGPQTKQSLVRQLEEYAGDPQVE
jgi:thioredoxin 1